MRQISATNKKIISEDSYYKKCKNHAIIYACNQMVKTYLVKLVIRSFIFQKAELGRENIALKFAQ